MSRLIKNELTKIFKKKSIYITLFVVLAFVILTNSIYKFFYHSGSYDEYSDNYIQYAKEEIKKLDPNKPSDTKMYFRKHLQYTKSRGIFCYLCLYSAYIRCKEIPKKNLWR